MQFAAPSPAFLLLCTFWALRAFALVKAKQKANALPGKVIILMSHLESQIERVSERKRERGLEREPNYNIITHTETLSFDIRERDSHATPGGWAGTVDDALWPLCPLWALEVNSVVGRRQRANQIPRVAF